jgi:CPA2 family monovalent cation:H+ antiporter-2
VSIIANPVLYRTIEPVVAWVNRSPRLSAIFNRAAPVDGGGVSREMRASGSAHRAVLIGYGPTGKTVARLLKEAGIDPTIVELNIETVRTIRESGIDAVYGDATRPETLLEAGIASADNLILTSAGMANSSEVIRAAREANARIRVLARVSYLRDLPDLRHAGADTVYAGEGEVALAFVEDLLSRLGATAEQIDRERARAHTELFGDTASPASSTEPRSA